MSESTQTDIILSRLDDLLALSHTPRWVTHPVTREQSVALHSYRVAVLAMAIRDGLSTVAGDTTLVNVDEAVLLRWALLHDGPEAKTGDIPRPFKHLLGEREVDQIELDVCEWFRGANPGGVEEYIVGIADVIEALSWLVAYGHGMRCRFDNHVMEDGFRKRIHHMADGLEGVITGGKEAVLAVLARVAP